MTLRTLISVDHFLTTAVYNSAATVYGTAGPLNTAAGLPGSFIGNSGGWMNYVSGWLGIGASTASNISAYVLSFADAGILQNGNTQAWFGFRTMAPSAANNTAINCVGLNASPLMTGITPLLTEAQLNRPGAGINNAQYVEVFLDIAALVYQVYVSGVMVTSGTLAGGQNYIVFCGVNFNATVGPAYRDMYFLDVDATKPNGRLGPITSAPITPTQSASQLANYGAFQYGFGGSAAAVVTTQSKFGPGSFQPNLATNGNITIPDQANLKTISTDITYECWVCPVAAGASGVLFCKSGSTAPYAQLFLNGGVWQLYTDTTPAVITIASGMQPNVWYHIAVVRYQGTWYLYQNGVLLGTAVGGSFGNNASSLLLGNSGAFTNAWPGYIDEFRVSNTARYTAAFTPPAQAFTTDANTMLLLHLDSQAGQLVADYSGNQPTAFQTALGAAPTMTPLLQNGADNQAISLAFAPTVQAGQKVVAMQYKLAAQVPFAMNMLTGLVEGATTKTLSPYQFRDNTAQYGRDLAGIQALAPDGTAWTATSIAATALVLQPQSNTAGATN